MTLIASIEIDVEGPGPCPEAALQGYRLIAQLHQPVVLINGIQYEISLDKTEARLYDPYKNDPCEKYPY